MDLQPNFSLRTNTTKPTQSTSEEMDELDFFLRHLSREELSEEKALEYENIFLFIFIMQGIEEEKEDDEISKLQDETIRETSFDIAVEDINQRGQEENEENEEVRRDRSLSNYCLLASKGKDDGQDGLKLYLKEKEAVAKSEVAGLEKKLDEWMRIQKN
ncbi:hypothetical protein ACJX0J_040232, partial [Zea mays]